jgi:GxxExxY protein
MIENQLIIEVKSVERLMPIHEAQLITYLRLTGLPVGLLLNFNTNVLKNGIRRLVHPQRLTSSL